LLLGVERSPLSWQRPTAMPRARTRASREEGPLTREELEKKALQYLNRFDTSRANLRRVLLGYVKRAAETRGDEAAATGPALVEALLSRYEESGLVDDARFAGGMALGMRRRGSSRRAIVQKLASRGISREVADAAVAELDADAAGNAELEAARAFVKRRRLGPFRPEGEREARRQKDLGAMARAGFSLDVARRALGSTGDDDGSDEF
jgi:regulatory protein